MAAEASSTPAVVSKTAKPLSPAVIHHAALVRPDMLDENGACRVQHIYGRGLIIGHELCVPDGIGHQDGCHFLCESVIGHGVLS